MHNVAICAIIKNEARYLAEWLEYHTLIGVSHFYIYDNNSADNIKEVCAAFGGSITLISWPLREDQQRQAYMHYVETHAASARWTAFIDGDEFIAYKGKDSLSEYLDRHSDKSAILMRWVIFGTSGHVVPPVGLVVENFTMTHTVSPNPYWKTICRAVDIDVQRIDTPHHFPYLTDDPVEHPELDTLCLYHYMLRSEQDVLMKVARGDAWSAVETEKKKRNIQASAQAYLRKYNSTDLYDDYMSKYCAVLKERLTARGLFK